MAKSLIAVLDGLAGKTPDEVVEALIDPFPNWRQTQTLTLEEYQNHRELRIVICNEAHRNRPGNRTERRHKIGTQNTDGFHRWSYSNYTSGVLSQDRWWFRSLKSWEGNPDEGF